MRYQIMIKVWKVAKYKKKSCSTLYTCYIICDYTSSKFLFLSLSAYIIKQLFS